jgi:hypothetical protein
LLRSARKQIGLCVPGLLRANFDAMALKAFGLLRQGLIGLKKRKMGPERPVSPELSRKSLFFRREKAIDPEGLTARKQEWDRGLWPDVFLRALRASQGKICHFESSGAGNACKKGWTWQVGLNACLSERIVVGIRGSASQATHSDASGVVSVTSQIGAAERSGYKRKALPCLHPFISPKNSHLQG